VDVDRVATEAHQLGELVGLALRGIGKASLEIDLVPDAVFNERELTRRKPLLIAASLILLAGVATWAGFNMVQNKDAALKLKGLESDYAELDQYAQPLKKLAKREKELDYYGSQFVVAQSARTLWVNILSDLAHNFASDTVWLVDFDPVVRFESSGAEANVGLAESVIVSDFKGGAYGDSSLAKISHRGASKASSRGGKRGRRVKAEKQKQMINAIRVKGFWRGGSGGYKTVYKLINKLRDHSLYFDVPRQEDLSISLSDKLEDGNYAAPFEFVIPLKKPIPAPEKNATVR
jgi:type IV pilus assembly protein PilM